MNGENTGTKGDKNMALFDKVFGRDEREEKLKQEIRSLELRKESVFQTINNEIARLQREQSNILFEAGKNAFEVWNKDKTQANLEAYWAKMLELDKQITEQEKKKTEMGNRYDEEISLISSNFNATQTTSFTAAPVSSGAGKCPSCGAAISNDDVFCQNCGAKLK